MPFTASGRYYRIVNGKRQYNPKYNRSPNKLKGRGGYGSEQVSNPMQVVKSRRSKAAQTEAVKESLGELLFGAGGSALGGLIGGPKGAQIGKRLGAGVFNMLGRGDYVNNFHDIRVNSLIKGGVGPKGSIGAAFGANDAMLNFCYSEYLGDLITSSSANTFNLTAYPINAANEVTFPFASQLSENYEQYQIVGMVFEFRSTSADALNSTNTALGTVMMATNYDAVDVNFASKGEMLNYMGSVSGKPCDGIYHGIECAPKLTSVENLYCLPGSSLAVPTGADPRLYFLGLFQIATTGFQGTSVNIGEIYVHYHIKLMKPKLYATLGNANELAHYTNAVGVSASNPLGTVASAIKIVDNIGLVLSSSTLITFPQSQQREYFYASFAVTGGSAAVSAPSITLANATALSVAFESSNTTTASQYPAAGTSSTLLKYQVIFFTAGLGTIPTITLGGGGTFPTAVTGSSVLIMQLPNNIA